MKGPDLGALTKALAKNKYVLLVLCAGLALLLLPRRTADLSGSAEAAYEAVGTPLAVSGIPLDAESERIAALLGRIRGVGEARVLLSASGCVVVCAGADSPVSVIPYWVTLDGVEVSTSGYNFYSTEPDKDLNTSNIRYEQINP